MDTPPIKVPAVEQQRIAQPGWCGTATLAVVIKKWQISSR